VIYVVAPSAGRLAAVVAAACADHPHRVIVTDDVSEVQHAVAALDDQGDLPEAVCLVGPHDALPHGSFDDDTGHDDAVFTDNEWGMLATLADADRDSEGLPAVAVTRIPTLDPALVRRLLSVRDVLPASWAGGVAVTARTWQRASAAVLERIAPSGGVTLHTSPSLDDGGIRRLMGGSVGRLYFNVHGSDAVTYWIGDDGAGACPAVLRPETIGVAPNAVLVSEACYGARHDEPDTIALRFLSAGGSAFVGSTIIAWGPAAPPCSLADLIPAGVYTALDRGLSLGDAVLAARRAIVASARQEGRVTPQVVNTVSSFVAYGSPLARVAGAPKVARAATRPLPRGDGAATPRSLTSRGPGDVLGRVRSGQVGAGGALGAARERLAAQDRQLGWRRLGMEELPPGGLTLRFRTATVIQAELSALLGGEAAVRATVRVARYMTPRGEERMVYAVDDAAAVRRIAAVAVDAAGQVVGRYVTRGGRAQGSGR
jgi:hypothetical protein